MIEANEVRGEIDIQLDGQSFVLRPSYGAVIAFEKACGAGLIQLAMSAEASSLTLDQAAAIATECIKAQGEETEDASLRNVNRRKVGELIHGVGLMAVMPRLSMLLGLAATGGCNPDGSLKGEATTAGMTTETPDEN